MNNIKHIIITGATSGIGFETALDLASRGWKIGITWRNEKKGLAVIEQLRQKSGNNNISGYFCDLSSFESIRKCSESIQADFPVIDILINNAGTWETSFTETSEGIEQMFMVNFLAPVFLTKLLKPQLEKSPEARVINLSSLAHRFGRINKNDPECRKHFWHMRGYGNSKLFILLATKMLAADFSASAISVNALHPGVVHTHLFDKFPNWLWSLSRIMMVPVKKGARTSIFLATDKSVAGKTGKYFNRCRECRPSASARKKENIEYIRGLAEHYLKDK